MPDAARIRALNDEARTTLTGCRVVVTRSLAEVCDVKGVLDRVSAYCAFTPDNDPYGEHDLGFIELNGDRYLWKINYYDCNLEHHSPDPADPRLTKRVMNIMFANEY